MELAFIIFQMEKFAWSMMTTRNLGLTSSWSSDTRGRSGHGSSGGDNSELQPV